MSTDLTVDLFCADLNIPQRERVEIEVNGEILDNCSQKKTIFLVMTAPIPSET